MSIIYLRCTPWRHHPKSPVLPGIKENTAPNDPISQGKNHSQRKLFQVDADMGRDWIHSMLEVCSPQRARPARISLIPRLALGENLILKHCYTFYSFLFYESSMHSTYKSHGRSSIVLWVRALTQPGCLVHMAVQPLLAKGGRQWLQRGDG